MLESLLRIDDGVDGGGQGGAINAPPGSGGVGGGVDDVGGAGVAGTGVVGGDDGGGDAGKGGEPKPTGLTKEDITAILSEVGVGKVAASPGEGEKSYTTEELEQMFNFWKADPEFLGQLGLTEKTDAAKAFHRMRDGLAKQILTMADHRVNQLLGDLRTKDLGPMQAFVEEIRATKARDEFFDGNKDLQPYEEIVDAVALKIDQSGFKGTKKQMQDEIAKSAREVIKRFQAVKPGEGANGQKRSKMSTLTGGGQSGVNTGSRGVPAQLEGMDVFE
jgi:hypothetical protein